MRNQLTIILFFLFAALGISMAVVVATLTTEESRTSSAESLHDSALPTDDRSRDSQSNATDDLAASGTAESLWPSESGAALSDRTAGVPTSWTGSSSPSSSFGLAAFRPPLRHPDDDEKPDSDFAPASVKLVVRESTSDPSAAQNAHRDEPVAEMQFASHAQTDASDPFEDDAPHGASPAAPSLEPDNSGPGNPLRQGNPAEQIPSGPPPRQSGEPLPPPPPPAPENVAPAVVGEGDDQLSINIPNSDIREVLDLLSRASGLNILASRNVTGQVQASLTNVNVETALDAILRSTGFVARREGNFVYVGTPDDFRAMDHSLDRVGTRVFRPNYTTAAELQQLITPMLTPSVGTISISTAAEVGIASDTTSAGGDNFAGSEVVLVRDYQAVLTQVEQVVAEVDRRPLQVSIEAMIVSVSLDDEQSVGVDWELLLNRDKVRLIFGSPLGNLADIDVANNTGLKFGFLDSSVNLFLDALETVGETHVISSPRLMCLNKQRAEIHIGEERGYISTTVTETAATQTVEFLELGTQLRLRPYISTDGLIRLEIHPELSTGTVDVTGNFTLPNKTVTQVTTNVMVRDGATLVIGGLFREDLKSNVEQVPLFGSLPYVGPLFRKKNDTTSREEIIVLITPRIVWDPKFNCEGEYAACESHQQHAILADKMSHVSRVYYGRRYTRLAKAAWDAGDAKAALRYANMAIHFDNVSREAIRVRSQIIAGSGYGDETVDTHLRQGLTPWKHPNVGGHLTNWVLDELHSPHTHVGQQPAPAIDAGTPGRQLDVEAPLPDDLLLPEFKP